MTSAYDSKRDVLNFRDEQDRGLNPHRYAQPVVVDTELAIYGPLWVSNSHATATQNINVVLASNVSDDVTAISFPIAPLTSVLLPVVARRVLSSSGGNISAVVLA